jgi:hypothetical protein
MENNEPTRLQGVVQKGWGYEVIWATTEKILWENDGVY